MATRDFSRAETHVFWDVDDFPVPEGRDLYWFRETLQKRLVKLGYSGVAASITAYGSAKPEEVVLCYTDAKIPFNPINSKYRRVNRMLVDICFWRHEHPCSYDDPIVLLVIAKDHRSAGFNDYLLGLALKDFTVILVYTMAEDYVPPPVIHTWSWEHLLLLDDA